jgi:hypothetical protein
VRPQDEKVWLHTKTKPCALVLPPSSDSWRVVRAKGERAIVRTVPLLAREEAQEDELLLAVHGGVRAREERLVAAAEGVRHQRSQARKRSLARALRSERQAEVEPVRAFLTQPCARRLCSQVVARAGEAKGQKRVSA